MKGEADTPMSSPTNSASRSFPGGALFRLGGGLRCFLHNWFGSAPLRRLGPFSLGAWFRDYFYSGWTFFLPYFVTYLLYSWRGWPATDLGRAVVKGVPSLLDVYWIFHKVHLFLLTIAVVSWWRSLVLKDESVEGDHNSRLAEFNGGNRGWRASGKRREVFWRALPWLLVAGILLYTGSFMEWPADPWEHYARINAWGNVGTINQHYFSKKPSYFLQYSFLSVTADPATKAALAGLLSGFSTLLLSWQYYRLARAVGLGPRTGFLFCVIQILTAGNNVFSFSRYYGLSGAMFAQISAVALLRVALTGITQLKFSSCRLENTKKTVLGFGSGIFAGASLVGLTASSHLQGLGIAALSCFSAAAWYVWEHFRNKRLAFVASFLALNLLLFYLGSASATVVSLRKEHWLSPLLGFHLASITSPAAARMVQVFGGFGLLNLAAAVVLLLQRHVVGALTLCPVVGLALPVFTIPFVHLLAPSNSSDILVFNRMFFSVPSGLAIITLLRTVYNADPIRRESWAGLGALATLGLVMAMPPNAPFYNRVWNTLAVIPDDLSMQHITRSGIPQLALRPSAVIPPLLTTRNIGYIVFASGARNSSPFIGNRLLIPPLIPSNEREDLTSLLQRLAKEQEPACILVPPVAAIITPASQAAFMSGHWTPVHVALDHAGATELERVVTDLQSDISRGSRLELRYPTR